MNVNQVSDKQLMEVIASTIQILQTSWGTKVQIRYTDGTSQCNQKVRNGQHILTFGLPCVRSMMRYGFTHPRTRPTTGWGAVVCVAVHEYAHVIQTNLDMLSAGSIHNREFYDLYNRMILPTWTKVESKRVFN